MSKPSHQANWNELKRAVFVRDQHRCVNCLRATDDAPLDADHSVPRGVGGSDRISNLNTLCRRCDQAKHGDSIAPSIQLESTGKMTDVEFFWFKHMLNEMIPAMAREIDVRLIPKFGLDDDTVWYLPLGDIRLLDRQLTRADQQYSSLRLEEYM